MVRTRVKRTRSKSLSKDEEIDGPKSSVPFTQSSTWGDEAEVYPNTPNAFARLNAIHVVIGLMFVLFTFGVAILTGPFGIPPTHVLESLAGWLPLIGTHSTLNPTEIAVIWQIRLPRIVLGGLVGAMLSLGGAAYQGVFRNPLADPYLLGVAAGAGLGATFALVTPLGVTRGWLDPVPVAAFFGALLAVSITYGLGRSRLRGESPASMILAGVAVAAFFTAAQTFLLQRQSPAVVVSVYDWILGGLATAGWSQVRLILPYVTLAVIALIVLRRLLDVLSVGDDEAASLGVHPDRVRLAVVIFATLGTSAAVSVSGLIGFVGIIVPHLIRLTVGPSYRRIVPLSAIYGAGFLILADLVARTALSPGEIPLGVVTAFLGAPFFLVVLRKVAQAS